MSIPMNGSPRARQASAVVPAPIIGSTTRPPAGTNRRQNSAQASLCCHL